MSMVTDKAVGYVMAVCVAVLCSVMMAGCSGDAPEISADGGDGQTSLVLHIGAADIAAATRADEIPDLEKMHSVRVVLTDENGTVEHNLAVRSIAPMEQHSFHFALSPGRKKIFIIANEESVADRTSQRQLSEVLNATAPCTPGFDKMIDNVVFVPDPTLPTPMSATYDIDIHTGENNRTFYVVRSVTKFTFNFENIRKEEVKVNSISISSLADKSYLMAHVGASDLMKHNVNGDLLHWVDWLREVADGSREVPRNPANGQFNDRVGWIKDYSLPDDAVMTEYALDLGGKAITVPAAVTAANGRATAGKLDGVGPFYTTESRNFAADASADADQSYWVTFGIEGLNRRLTKPLEAVKALFRNTHVIVDVFMTKDIDDPLQVVCTVDVQPYSSVDLRPDFGLERDEENNIVNRDQFGYLTDENGRHIDAYGNPATLTVVDGKPVSFRDHEGYILNKNGYPVDENGVAGYRDEDEHRVRNFMGYIMNKEGQLIDKDGNPAYHDTSVTDKYVVRDSEGHIIDYEGHRIDSEGKPIN